MTALGDTSQDQAKTWVQNYILSSDTQMIEAYAHLLMPLSPLAVKKGIYDKFGEEGLKGGIPLEFGSENPWSVGYVFHGNADKVFKEFFGGDNPFAGRYNSFL